MKTLPASRQPPRPRLKREPPIIKRPRPLSDRDVAILKAVYEHEILTSTQIQILFFRTSRTTNQVLQSLFHQGFLKRTASNPYNSPATPILYTIDKAAIGVLREVYGIEIERLPSVGGINYEFLQHTLAITDVQIAFSLASQQNLSAYQLVTVLGERALKADYDHVALQTKKGKTLSVSVIPDSFFLLHTSKGKAPLLLELDRGRSSVKRFRRKVQAYLAYDASGAYSQRFGVKSMRVITVTTTLKHLEVLKYTTEQVGGGDQFWFALMSDVTPDRVLTAEIWHVAGREGTHLLVS